VSIEYRWRGELATDEVNALHAEAFATRLFGADEWNWESLLPRHSLGWVVARDRERLVGFVNVIWDGCAHAWIQDAMVASDARGMGIGTSLVDLARGEAQKAGCEWLHVDFENDLGGFYYDACGFTPTSAGLIRLQESN
jgi:ribosomal protein S18 acetylase RimI-like enzyme